MEPLTSFCTLPSLHVPHSTLVQWALLPEHLWTGALSLLQLSPASLQRPLNASPSPPTPPMHFHTGLQESSSHELKHLPITFQLFPLNLNPNPSHSPCGLQGSTYLSSRHSAYPKTDSSYHRAVAHAGPLCRNRLLCTRTTPQDGLPAPGRPAPFPQTAFTL